MKTLYARGAYGRKASRADWDDGKDFQACSTGQYFSNRDLRYLRNLRFTQIVFVGGTDLQPLFTVRLDDA